MRIKFGADCTYLINGTTDTTGLMNDEIQIYKSEHYYLTETNILDSFIAAEELKNCLESDKAEFVRWLGDNKVDTIVKKATEIKNKVLKSGYRSINLIGHSHGGNIMIVVAYLLSKHSHVKIFNLITLNTPAREDFQLSASLNINHIHLYNSRDFVVKVGHIDQDTAWKYILLFIYSFVFPFVPIFASKKIFNNEAYKFKNAYNIDVYKYKFLFSRKDFIKYIKKPLSNAIKTIKLAHKKRKKNNGTYKKETLFYNHQITRSVSFVKEILSVLERINDGK